MPSYLPLRYRGDIVQSVVGEWSDWHTHDFGQLISARAGSLYVGTDNRILLLSRALVIWIPPHARHWMRSSVNNEMLYVDIEESEALYLGSAFRVMSMSPLLNALMCETLPTGDASRSMEHRTLLCDLLRQEIITAPDVPLSLILPRNSRVRKIVDVALEDPGCILSVSEWIGMAPASRKTVERIFQSETGLTPSQWLRQARLLHAISRLSLGYKVSTVAIDMGYQSASAFTFMFRQTLGICPTMFLGGDGAAVPRAHATSSTDGVANRIFKS